METKEAKGCALEDTTRIKERLARKGHRALSKKNTSRKAKPGKKQGGNGKSRKTLIITAISAIVVVVFVVVVVRLKETSKKASFSVSSVDDQSLRKGETRKTLSPSLFADPFVASMYQAAKDFPQVFDSVKCYCFCERAPFYHVSLLSCFVDRHAET